MARKRLMIDSLYQHRGPEKSEVADDNQNPNSVDVQIEFSDRVTKSIAFNLTSSGKGSTPSVKYGSVLCLTIPDANIQPAAILGGTVSKWYWRATIESFADGILTLEQG